MAEKQCIFKANGKENSENIDLIAPCFEIGSEVTFKEVPTTGEEYLLKVIKERKKYAVITKCNKDYSKYSKNQSCFVEEFPHAAVPGKLKPTIEWQNIQVADFSEVRMYLSRLRSNKSLWPSNIKKIEVEHTPIDRWKSFLDKNEPTLTCVLGLQYVLVDRGLEVLIEMLGDIKPGQTVDHKIGQWIYAFLACIRQPLLSETISIIRELARKCAEIRSHINEDDEDAINAVTPLNLFICLVGRYFRQYDLADQ